MRIIMFDAETVIINFVIIENARQELCVKRTWIRTFSERFHLHDGPFVRSDTCRSCNFFHK